MEFLESTFRNFVLVGNCIQQGNADFLALLAPNLAHYYSTFVRIKDFFIDDENVSEILLSVLNLFRHQLYRCDSLLMQATCTSRVESRLPVVREQHVGQPRLDIPVDQVVTLHRCGLTWPKIAKALNISRQSLWNFRRLNNVHDARAYSNISDEELSNMISSIKQEHPSMGYRYIWASLKARQIFVTWERLISSVRLIDPIGILNRCRRRLRRRQYWVKGANYMWHLDGNEKLVNWNLYVHGCTNGFSRRIIYLRLATTKKAETVLDIFTQGVDKNGLPMRVRGDWGTENAEVINFMESRRSNIDSPFIQGRSVHNTRIKRLWAEVNLIVTSKFRQIFYYLEDNNFLHQSSVLDLLCLIYVYFFRIQQSLNNLTNSWNNHGLRTERYVSPNELWLTSLLQLHSERDLFSLEMLPESLDLNETVAPTNFQMRALLIF